MIAKVVFGLCLLLFLFVMRYSVDESDEAYTEEMKKISSYFR